MSITLLRPAASPWGVFVWGSGIWGGTGWGAYPLPATLILGHDEQELRFDSWELAFADGGASAGEEVKSRVVQVSGKLLSASRSAQTDLINTLKLECARPNQKLSIDGGATYINLAKLRNFDAKPQALSDRILHDIRIDWQCDDPYWHGPEESRTFTVLGNTTLTVDALTGLKECLRGQSPVITVTSPALGTLPSFTLKNTSDADLQCRYSDPELRMGASVIIDCVAGRVSRGGVNTVNYFEGEFLRLLRSDSVQYTGQPATINFTWQHRWL